MMTTYVTLFLLGAVFIGTGLLLIIAPPKKINNIYGYRTGRSMQSQRHWDYAQGICGRLMVLYSIAGTAVSVAMAYNLQEQYSALTLILLATAVLITGIGFMVQRVEKALMKLDDDS